MKHRFQKGKSGNASGRPRGSLNKATALLRELEGDLPALIETLKTSALAGDLPALKMLLDRLLPVRRSSHEPVELPQMAEAETLTAKAEAVLTAVADGDLPPDIGALLVNAIGTAARVEEMTELKERLEALERTIKSEKKS